MGSLDLGASGLGVWETLRGSREWGWRHCLVPRGHPGERGGRRLGCAASAPRLPLGRGSMALPGLRWPRGGSRLLELRPQLGPTAGTAGLGAAEPHLVSASTQRLRRAPLSPLLAPKPWGRAVSVGTVMLLQPSGVGLSCGCSWGLAVTRGW